MKQKQNLEPNTSLKSVIKIFWYKAAQIYLFPQREIKINNTKQNNNKIGHSYIKSLKKQA